MRVAIALSLLALILVLIIMALYVVSMKNLSNMINATLYYEDDNYYLVLNITNRLPITMIMTVTSNGLNKSLVLNPFASSSLVIPVKMGEIINITVSIPGLVSESTGVRV